MPSLYLMVTINYSVASMKEVCLLSCLLAGVLSNLGMDIGLETRNS